MQGEKSHFKETKIKLLKSGKGRRTCKHFEELDSILGNRLASSTVKVISTMSEKRSFECEDENDSSESESIDTGVRPLENLDESGDDDESCPATNTKDNKQVGDATDTDNKEEKRKKAVDLQKRP